MDEIKAKQLVVEKIKEATKILVTVSDNPSVDALSAALGLTLLLDKQQKYATAIFSGETPPAIAFLEPEKTFDDTTDSLRDFIIALNKEKADHLRYKVEGDSVKIFITPYKTTITEKDLEFSQGDYNVELVIALGVDNQDHLDHALASHGQILHDAAIITMTAGDQTSDLGGTDWHDSNSSSLSEMVAGLAEALKDDKKKSLLDAPIATALLTGIVAATDRFSNEHTTSRAMTVAATLMGAGADQQLIANELQAAHSIEVKTPEDEGDGDDDGAVIDKDSGDGSLTIKKDGASSKNADTLEISHEGETLADLDRRIRGEEKAKEKVAEEVEAIQERAAEEEAQTKDTASITDVKSDVAPAISDVAVPDTADEPTLGGTLNATTELAADEARREAESDQNKTILSHSYLGGGDDTPVTPGSVNVSETPAAEEVHTAYALTDDDIKDDTPAATPVGGERVIQPISEPAPNPVAPSPESVSAVPPASNPTPADLGLPLPPPIPDFSQLNGVGVPPAPAIPLPPTQQPAILGDILAPEPSPDTLNAVPAPNTPYAFEEPAPAPAPVEPAPLETPAPAVPPVNPAVPPLPPLPEQPLPPQNTSDPGQFQIPTPR